MQPRAGSGEVPPHPLVQVEIDADGVVLVNGRPEPHDVTVGRAGAPRELARVAVLAVARDYAMPLGRPVRVEATTPEEGTRLVVHPDADVTGIEPLRHDTPAGVPPATRAQNWLAARDADRATSAASAEQSGGVRRRRRVAALVAAGVAGTAAALAVSVGGDRAVEVTNIDRVGDVDVALPEPPGPTSTNPGTEPAPFVVLPATRLQQQAVADVGASASPGSLVLALRSTRETSVAVEVRAVGGGATQRVRLAMPGGSTRDVVLDELAPGSYAWSVRAPGQAAMRGVVDVPAVPEQPEEPVTVPVADPPTTPEPTPEPPAASPPPPPRPQPPPAPPIDAGTPGGPPPSGPVDPDEG